MMIFCVPNVTQWHQATLALLHCLQLVVLLLLQYFPTLWSTLRSRNCCYKRLLLLLLQLFPQETCCISVEVGMISTKECLTVDLGAVKLSLSLKLMAAVVFMVNILRPKPFTIIKSTFLAILDGYNMYHNIEETLFPPNDVNYAR